MKNSTLLDGVSKEEFTSYFAGLQDQITELKQNFQPKVPNEYLTRNELADLLKCDLSTIHNWTKKGKLNPYGMGNRVYYKRSEVESALRPLGNGNKKGANRQVTPL